ncbi:MAG: DUF459 domain-containing protein [Gammaproteobacteria bacterium]|nr:DUF459 domain-containing protein [Gammaproteobacteria bacterium]MBU1654004.1 DUF459 domain-containing protein [Gammaproteobacteria bacterium]MBU1960737.1 DUF459 domain-containing protein [Gammaproteobacteria bacterium]
MNDKMQPQGRWWLLARLWGMALVLALFSADEVRDFVEEQVSDLDSEESVLFAAADAWVDLADISGMLSVREGFESVRKFIHTPRVIMKQPRQLADGPAGEGGEPDSFLAAATEPDDAGSLPDTPLPEDSAHADAVRVEDAVSAASMQPVLNQGIDSGENDSANAPSATAEQANTEPSPERLGLGLEKPAPQGQGGDGKDRLQLAMLGEFIIGGAALAEPSVTAPSSQPATKVSEKPEGNSADTPTAAGAAAAVERAVPEPAASTDQVQVAETKGSLRLAMLGNGYSDIMPPAQAQAQAPAHSPSAAAPDRQGVKRVLLIGASSMQYALGQGLERAFKRYQGVSVRRFGKAATGLARPDVLDWHAKLDGLIRDFRPDLIVANFGGNDAQNLSRKHGRRAVFGRKDWEAVYGPRVEQLVRQGRKTGAQFIVLGMPVMASGHFDGRMKTLNGILERWTKKGGGIYIDTRDLSSDGHGSYKTRVTLGGREYLMRQPDGVHYTDPGGAYVADRLLGRIERHARLGPKKPQSASSIRFAVSAKDPATLPGAAPEKPPVKRKAVFQWH